MTEELATKPTVLVIDDTPDNLALINGLLKDSCKVKVAKSGERGLALAVADPLPDLVLLDIMMPEMDGWEVCRRLKADARTRPLPVVFLTASTDAESQRMGFELGAADFITKPINPAALLECVKKHLAR